MIEYILDKSLPKPFYEGVIYRTAERIREKDKKHRMPSRFDNKLISANLYVYYTEKIFALFKKDIDHYWDLRSIQRELDFSPGEEFALDDSEVQFLLKTLVNYGYIDATDRENRFDSERPLYYRLAFNYHVKPTPWYVENRDLICFGMLFCYIGYCIIPFIKK